MINKTFFPLLKKMIVFAIEVVCLPFLMVLSLLSRAWVKKIQIGIGPEPLINNVYHKLALEKQGFSVETFVSHVYVITDQFDIRGDQISSFHIVQSLYLFVRTLFCYESLYIYYTGGALGSSLLLWRFEPFFYLLANIRTIVMGYGTDVQDLTRTKNLNLKFALAKEYPLHRVNRKTVARKIDFWSGYGSHVISGCEWVDYVAGWDTLTLGHFSIDLNKFTPYLDKPRSQQTDQQNRPLKIFHAPNHRLTKGTRFFIQAVAELQAEGLNVELVMKEKVSNQEILKTMCACDVVADQLMIGWYAMFAIEAMAMKKPVLCFLRPDLLELYQTAGIIQKNEVPLINCHPSNVKEIIKRLAQDRASLYDLGEKSRRYVEKFHSLESMGRIFTKINGSLGIMPNI